MEIKILGKGCPNCQRLERSTHEVVDEMSIPATITKVTDMAEIVAYDIVTTPGLVIDEKVVLSGRVPSKSELTSLIAAALSTAEQ